MIIAAVLLTDIISLVVLGIFFQFFNSLQLIPSILYLILILILIIGVYLIFPFITKLGIKLGFSDEDAYEGRIRFILVLAIGLLIVFSFLKVHPILAAFLAGIILSENIKDLKKRDVYHKIHVLGYGLFIPIFFFIVGMELNLSLFLDFNLKNMVIIFLIPGLIISKVVSGYLSGKLVGLKNKESFIYGAISMTHLTTALAATYAASSLGILDNVLVSSIILISIITVILGPASVDYISRKTEQEKL